MSGEGAPRFALLHAFGSAGRAFDHIAAALASQGPAWAPDLPGFGEEPALAEPTVAAYADWVQTRLGAAQPRSVLLAGWSMGGKIALALAARRPAWLEGLVLLAPSPPAPEPMDEDDRRRQFAGHGDAALARTSVTELVGPGASSDRVDAAIADRLRTSPAAWRWWLEAGSRETLDLGDPPPSARIVVGADDPNLGEATQRRLTLPRLPSAELEIVPGCRHFLPLEAPQAVAAHLAAAAFRASAS